MSSPDLWRWPVPTGARYPTQKAAIHLTAEDLLRLALSAYYAAVREMQPPAGERWLPDPEGVPWSCPENLHNDVLHQLGERMWAHAAANGHLDPDPGAGRSPAVEGHGCPALAPAVGPAPTPCPTGEPARESGNRGLHNLPVDPLFCGPELQELPGQPVPATVTQQRGSAP